MRRLLALLPLSTSVAFAHEKWFHDATQFPLRWDLFFTPLPLALVGAVLIVTLLAWLFQRARGGQGFLPGFLVFGATQPRLTLLYAVIPAILAVHLAVPLLVNGVEGTLFSPNNELQGGWAYPLGLLQVGVALALFYGGFTRIAALVLAAMWFVGLFVAGFSDTLDNIHYLGFAAFFWLAGRGPLSVGRLVLPRMEPPRDLARFAVPALRICTALSLIFVAFSEKFANLPLATSFLGEYPLNVAANFGLGISDQNFALLAGSIELLVGLFLLFNIFPREIIVIAWLPFNLTLTVFRWEELVGHLPYYGIMALLLVWWRGRENEDAWRRGLHDAIMPSRPRADEGAALPDDHGVKTKRGAASSGD